MRRWRTAPSFWCRTWATAIEIANRYAPEHLILQVAEPRRWLEQVQSAGSVFLGPWTPESVGDYCSGTNHVLPTYGFARAYSGLSVGDFERRMTVQELTPAGLAGLAPTVQALAGLEGLDCARRGRDGAHGSVEAAHERHHRPDPARDPQDAALQERRVRGRHGAPECQRESLAPDRRHQRTRTQLVPGAAALRAADSAWPPTTASTRRDCSSPAAPAKASTSRSAVSAVPASTTS